MAAVKSYARLEDFWFKYSDLVTKSNGQEERKQWSWTKVLKALKKFKKITDISDAEEARELYDDEEFAKHFSYRKGKKMVLMKDPIRIARQYRKLKNAPRFWDYVEEEEKEEEEEEDLVINSDSEMMEE
jgi:hypothetical protein